MQPSEKFAHIAHARGLNQRESAFLFNLAQKLHIDPYQVLINKDIFDALHNAYPYKIDKTNMLTNIYQKLFTSSFTLIESTQSIPKDQKAKFYFTAHDFVPLLLISHHKHYMLWKLELHGKMDMVQPQMQGFLIFQHNHLTYKLVTTIQDIISLHADKFVKIPQSTTLTPLIRRQVPRIDVDIEGVIKRPGRLRDNPYYKCRLCDISENGAKISLSDNLFSINDHVEMQWKLRDENITTQAKIVNHTPSHQTHYYNITFIDMLPRYQSLLQRYITMYNKDESII